jgi:hypothetical protein
MSNDIQFQIANGAILAYKRLPYQMWYAIAEFVDNSVESARRPGNKEIMDEVFKDEKTTLQVEVTLDKETKTLRIFDNSIGMAADELAQAMIVGKPPVRTSGLSEFGMGMKTAAIWIADEMTLRTKKFGDTEEIEITLNLDKYASGDNDLSENRRAKPAGEHYTIIELRRIRKGLGPKTVNKTKEFLGSIYREEIRNKTATITFNGEEIEDITNSNEFLKRADGSEYKVALRGITVNNKPVNGWIGVLSSGGRQKSGFAIIRAGRAVKGYLDAWKPVEIFGENSNSLVNQRLTGEIYVDYKEFGATHIKDGVDFDGDEEEELGEALRKFAEAHGLIKAAKEHRKDDPIDPREIDEAQDALGAQLNNTTVIDQITIVEVPSPQEVELRAQVLPDGAQNEDPFLTVLVGQKSLFVYEVDLSPNDPYFDFEVQANLDLKIFINGSHPILRELSTAEGRLSHYHHIITEALSEWKCAQMQAPLEPKTIRMLKDSFFKTIAQIESD